MTNQLEITISARLDGTDHCQVHARLWTSPSGDRAELTVEGGTQSFHLEDEMAMAFLAMVARDSADLLAPEAPGSAPRRRAGF